MFTVSGKYNTAKVMTNAGIDDATMSQIIEMCNLESLAGENLAIMPDCHAGAGCTIGTTMTISNAVIPNFVGVDIGCGVLAAHLKLDKHPDFSKLDSVIRKRVPSGFDVHSRSSILAIRRDQTELDKLHCKDHVDLDRAALSLGTLGGGNHFIEIDRDVTGEYWLLIHTGSRYLGKQVAEYYQNEAHKQCSKWDEARQKAVDELKRQGRQQEIEAYLKAHPVQKLPKQVAHLSGRLMQDYLDDIKSVRHMLNETASVLHLLLLTTWVGRMMFMMTSLIPNIIISPDSLMGSMSFVKELSLRSPVNGWLSP